MLVGCQGPKITLEEARERAAEILEHWENNPFPTKFSYTLEEKYQLSDSTYQYTESITLDVAGKYLYIEISESDGQETTGFKEWLYYDSGANKTYLVAEDDDTKGHGFYDGDAFESSNPVDDFDELPIFYFFEHLSELMSSPEHEDDRTEFEYRSRGFGDLYMKGQVVTGEFEGATRVVEIADYLLTQDSTKFDENNYSYLNAKYKGFPTPKPNLSEYPYGI